MLESPMNFTIDTDPENNLVTVNYTPDTSYQDRIDALNELIEICKSHSSINILIDTRNAKKELTLDEQKKLGALIASNELQFKRNKTAIVEHFSSYPNFFITAVAATDGFSRTCQFGCKSDAILWLNNFIK